MTKLLCGLSVLALLSFSLSCDREAGSDPGISQENLESENLIIGGVNGLRVMTWNVYVGTNVDKVLRAESPQEIPILAAEALQMLIETNFPERADAIARQVRRYRPHLIGLQEISLFRIQSPGDLVLGGTEPAEDVFLDFLQILMDALAEQGLHYQVAAQVQNTDVEIPVFVDINQPLDDIRLTDYDVVLSRRDVTISDPVALNYQVRLPVPSLGIEVLRGYAAVTAEVRGAKYRFINTHLEPPEIAVEIQQAQLQELLATIENEELPVVLVGDFNTEPQDDTYGLVLGGGFEDVWESSRRRAPYNPDGLTGNHPLDLQGTDFQLSKRIDYLFARNPGNVRSVATVIGDHIHDKTISGMWPSDHAGVVARIWTRPSLPVIP